ncbi:hypothetical protein LT85_p022 (plasmid) [Collimonas arenae]|uniref:Type VI secretion protein n=1 Tax=Collimonas arenae TaxID=279058 RepID=A0A0A1FHZ7_9BURK|nr:TrbC/VirB2 family protein [Collimonas arenae]AIY44201.1 hypothetical protein LT85_p022 [Collimonas arenae]
MNSTQKPEVVADKKVDKLDAVLGVLVNTLVIAFVFMPEFAHAQTTGSPFDGATAFLKMAANLLIFEWGYYIGIITLAIQGYRWKTGRINLMDLGGWGLGICLVFFAPNIVLSLKNSAGTIQ